MTRKKSNTSHLLILRTYDGKLYHRYHSYNGKSDANKMVKGLKKQGIKVRVHNSPTEKYRYTIYTRKS